MRIPISISAFMLVTVAALTACTTATNERAQQQQSPVSSQQTASPTPTIATTQISLPQATPRVSVRRITVSELQAALARGEAVVIDVRSEAQYNDKHIKGAQHIASNDIATRAAELPRNKMLVTYCS